MPGLSIKLVGENILTGAEDGIRFSTLEPSTIEGPGTLQVSGGVGIRGDKFTICGGANVTVEGTSRWAIFGQLTVSGEETVVAMKSAESAYYGSSLTLEDDLIIGIPQGAYFKYGSIVDADGSPVKGQWVIIAQQDYITGAEHIPGLVQKEENIYNVAGQRVSKDYKGIIISNGKKLIK
jgi:hypothetical protein